MDVTLIRIVLGLAICFAVYANPSYRDEEVEEASEEALNPGLKGKESVAIGLEEKLSSDEKELLDALFNAANADRSNELEERVLSEEKREKPIFEEENPAMKGKEKAFAALEAKLTREEQELLDELYNEGANVAKRESGMREKRGSFCWCLFSLCSCNRRCWCEVGRCGCRR